MLGKLVTTVVSILVLGFVGYFFIKPEPSFSVGSTIPNEDIKKFGKGFLILSGSCRSCLHLDRQLEALNGRRAMVVFVKEVTKKAPEVFEGLPTAELEDSVYSKLNHNYTIPRLIGVKNGVITSMQGVGEDYSTYVKAH